MRARRGRAVIVALVCTSGVLTGCAGIIDACPAIGYSSAVTITLENPRPGLTLEVCEGEGCTAGPPAEPRRVGEERPVDETSLTELVGSSANGWRATFILGGEPVLGYRLVDGVGAVVGAGHVPIEWVRIDGSEQCGGNRHADLELPV